MKGLVKTSAGYTGFTIEIGWDRYDHRFSLECTSSYYWVMSPKQLIVPMELL